MTVTYAGQKTDGTDCAETVTLIESYSPSGAIQSYQNTKPSYRSGTSVTPALTGGCSSYGDGYRECADRGSFEARAPVEAKWSVTRNECSGYSKAWDIGNADKLVLFNPCQTKSLSARTSWLEDITGQPKVCDPTFTDVPNVSSWSESRVKRILNMTKKAATSLNQTCNAYKAMRAVEWSVNDWFMFNASNNGACGVWVVDGASWRPAKIKSATRNSDGQGIPWISPGKTEYVRTATGSMPVTC